MPVRPTGVYPDGRGGWYFKATVSRDPLSGTRTQVTRRGFRTASEAAKARRELVRKVDVGEVTKGPAGLTVNELLDLYLDGLDMDGRLAPKTRYDYREKSKSYIRPLLGKKRVREITPEVVLAWQRRLTKSGVPPQDKPLAANTVRLARAPLAGAFKMAVRNGIISADPIAKVQRPVPQRSVPKYWTPDQARDFLALMDSDRTYPIWAFLIGSGLRIGELVALRWPSVDLNAGFVRVVDFTAYLGHDLVRSAGKSRDAIRSIDVDAGLANVLRAQRALQATECLAATTYEETDHVFTRPNGGPYHPQYLSRLLSSYSSELGLPRLSAHGLRHTCATLMLANGVPPKVAAERLGHADPTLFSNLYSHVTPTMQREAAEKIGAALFGPQR